MFRRFQIKAFFLPNISPPFFSPQCRAIKFVFCPYIRPGRINGIYDILIVLILFSFQVCFTNYIHQIFLECGHRSVSSLNNLKIYKLITVNIINKPIVHRFSFHINFCDRVTINIFMEYKYMFIHINSNNFSFYPSQCLPGQRQHYSVWTMLFIQ